MVISSDIIVLAYVAVSSLLLIASLALYNRRVDRFEKRLKEVEDRLLPEGKD